MEFPAGYPLHFELLVESALAKEEIALQKALDELSSKSLPRQKDHEERGNLAGLFVINVLRAFLPGTNEAARQGDWSLARSRTAVDEFMNNLIAFAHLRAGVDGPYPSRSAIDGFRDELIRKIKPTDLYQAYLDERRQVAEELAVNFVAGASPQAQTAALVEVNPAPLTSIEPQLNTLAERRAALKTFLALCNQEPDVSRRATQLDFSAIAGYKKQRQSLSDWLNVTDKVTAPSDQAFRRTLKMSPRDFIAALRKSGRLE